MADQEQPKRGRGRPGTYASAAERARAWRQRQKELIAQAQQPAAPIIIEKVVEKIVEKRVEVIADRNNTPLANKTHARTHGNAPGRAPDAGRLIPLLQPKFGAYGGEDRAKRLRSNAARAASTARDILGMFASYEPIPEAEKNFLEQAANFFDRLNAGFEVAQRDAKTKKAYCRRSSWPTEKPGPTSPGDHLPKYVTHPVDPSGNSSFRTAQAGSGAGQAATKAVGRDASG